MAVTEEILINVTPQETRVAVIEQGVTQEVHVERTSARGLVGNIYMGRVVRVLPGHAVGVHRHRRRARCVPARRRHLGEPHTAATPRARSSGCSPKARTWSCRW